MVVAGLPLGDRNVKAEALAVVDSLNEKAGLKVETLVKVAGLLAEEAEALDAPGAPNEKAEAPDLAAGLEVETMEVVGLSNEAAVGAGRTGGTVTEAAPSKAT